MTSDDCDDNELHEDVEQYKLSSDDITKYKEKYNFSKQQIFDFAEAFSVFDLDSDGSITIDELGTVMVGLGQRPSLQELEALIKGVDMDLSGSVDFDEFLLMMSKVLSDSEEELQEVFSVFDMNDDGFIEASELYELVRRLDQSINLKEVEGMIKEADSNDDGLIDFQDFKAILKGSAR